MLLGPLLFRLYINDISTHRDPGVSHLLYADDLQMYLQTSYQSFQDALNLLSSVAIKISAWAKNACLKLNPEKTRDIYFGSKT